MSTRSGTEFRAGGSATVLPDDMPEWAKSILGSEDETKVQLEFLMTQLLELKTAKSTEIYPLANTVGADSPPPPNFGEPKAEPHWDAAKKGAKPEVMTFDDSLDPKRYMDWEAGLDEYFDWYQLPEGRRIQFAQMKLTGQGRIYWRNLQATLERQHEPMTTSWAEMKSRLREKFVPACYAPPPPPAHSCPESACNKPLLTNRHRRTGFLKDHNHAHLPPPLAVRVHESPATNARDGATLQLNARLPDRRLDRRARYWSRFRTRNNPHHPTSTTLSRKYTRSIWNWLMPSRDPLPSSGASSKR